MHSSTLGPMSCVGGQQWSRFPHDVQEIPGHHTRHGTCGLPVEDAWVTSWPFATSTFSSILSRDRFSLILRFLHLNDSSKYTPKGQPGHDPLYKLCPLLDPLLANFQVCYTLGREITVDESMVGFKGLWFVQYMQKKPTKWGIKASRHCHQIHTQLEAGVKEMHVFVETWV